MYYYRSNIIFHLLVFSKLQTRTFMLYYKSFIFILYTFSLYVDKYFITPNNTGLAKYHYINYKNKRH